MYLRNIRNNPKMFLINISSFSIGIVAVLFITLYVVKEFNADRFHKKHNDIYRVLKNTGDPSIRYSSTEFPLGYLIKSYHSEIQNYTRFIDLKGYQITFEDKEFNNEKISYVDSSFFSIFDFNLVAGDYKLLFEQPNSLIIDKSTAKRYFNSIDVLGKIFTTEYLGEEEKKEYTIVGILDDYPEESTLHPHLITDIKCKAEKYEDYYFNSFPQLFLYIPNCQNAENLAQKLSATFCRKYNQLTGRNDPIDINSFSLQRLTNMYLKSTDVNDSLPKGDSALLWILVCVGIVLLLATFMNYLILTLGLSLKNKKQNQIRSILGGSSAWLKMKFASESVFYTIITFGVSLLLLPVLHHLIVSYSNFRYGIFSSSDPLIIGLFLIALIVIGALCGYLQYTILFHQKKHKIELSKFNSRKPFFRYLVQFQLFIFIVIISSIFIINRQINFIRNQDLGFDLKNTVSVMINDDTNKQLFLHECSTYTMVNHVSVGHSIYRKNAYLDEVKIDDSQTVVKSQCIFGDNQYIETYNIKLMAGENIDGSTLPMVKDYYSYQSNNILDILVNEEFVKKSGLKDPLGTIISINHNGISKGKITGLIKNVRNTPLYNAATPIIIGYGLSHMPDIIVSVKEGRLIEFKAEVDKFLARINKKSHFGYDTFTFDFEVWYQKEQTLLQLLNLLSIIVLVILFLGLFGVSVFLSENKTKEIGIRKVNGAKISEVLIMLNKDFVKWVIIAFVIATPIAYYAMHKWLENFAYKTELSWWIFALAGLLALGVALLTVSWQSWKAATRNPVEALRYE